jgi:phage terminase large subunit-like protein
LLDGSNALAAGGRLNEALDGFTARDLALLLDDWEFTARRDQWPPDLTTDGAPWRVWLILGGRGAGKTRAGAEWVKGLALGRPQFTARPIGRIALIGETAADVRDVMIEGVSGLLAVHGKGERPRWESSRRRLVWETGAVAQAFSAEDPESLRGPQFHSAWCDELAKWRYARESWDMLQFGLRLGDWPRQLVTTTPRPTPLLKELIAHPATALTRALTRENAANLAPSFLESVIAQYAGTRLGRQELDGEMIESRQDALWTRDMLEAARVKAAPPLARIVVAVDPPATSGKRADNCGIVAAGADGAGLVHVLDDATLASARPAQWARAAIALYHRLDADALVAEVNQGGEMVRAVLQEADASVPVAMVRATRGKYLRAAPVAQLYEQGRVRHVGAFPALEDEMCDFGLDGLSSGRSPDRLDALVWAITALALTPKAPEPRMRRV